MQDLFVNGTCIASGWGKGAEPIASLNDPSWIHIFANRFSFQNLWNHSLNNKPVGMSVQDTIGFCSQYYNRYKTYERLFVIVEFTGPQHELWKPVYETDVYSVIPTVFQLGDPANEDSEPYRSVFVRQEKQRDYLGTKEICQFYNPDKIQSNLLEIHNQQVKEYYSSPFGSFTKQLAQSREQIFFLMTWLEERNIRYLMNWATGIRPEFMRTVDRAFSRLPDYLRPRLIPMQQYTGFSKGVEWSKQPYGGHPDIYGQMRIAEFIGNWVEEHELFRSLIIA